MSMIFKKKLSKTAFSLLAATAVLVPVVHGSSLVADDAAVIDVDGGIMVLEMSKGRLIKLPEKVAEIIVADPSIADVKVISPTLIYVFGREFGETTLFALDKDQEVIMSRELSVQQNLKSIQIALDGYFPDSGVRVSKVGGLIVLEGRVRSAEDAELAQRLVEGVLLETMGGGQQGISGGRQLDFSSVIMNQIVIAEPSQVNLRVRFAEVSRSVSKDIGVSWDNQFASSGGSGVGFTTSGGPFASAGIDPITGSVTRQFDLPSAGSALFGGTGFGNFDLNFIIDALQDEGFLSTLAEPNLTTISGEESTFLAGGRFPIPVPNGGFGGITIQFENFGVGLTYKPTVLNSGRIRLEVEPEVSDLSDAGGISVEGFSIPAITSRGTRTTVELGSGESLAIAGLMQSRITKSADKVPGLGDIPILGALFRSESFRNSETELLVVVTPYLARPVSDRRILLPTDGFIQASDAERILKGYTWKPQARPSEAAGGMQEGASLRGRAGFQLN